MQLNDQPHAVDAVMHDTKIDLHDWLGSQPDGPVKTARALQVAIALDDQPEIQRLIPITPTDAPGHGLRALGWAALGVWEPILAAPPALTGHDPFSLECAVHSYTAYGIALAETGAFDQAGTAVQIAEVLAGGLGMTHRHQMLGLELDRVLNLAGRPVPERTQARLYTAMPDLRRQWGQRNLAESHMSLGCYSQALRVLGHSSTDGPKDAGLREFLHSILHLPPARLPGDPVLDPTDAYARLALAARDTGSKQKHADLDGITGQPEAAYAQLILAWTMYRSPDLLQPAADLLLSIQTERPDQQYFRQMFLLACYAAGARVPGPHHLIPRINRAIDRMRPEGSALSVVHGFAPEVTALLLLPGASTGAHERLRGLDLTRVPMLLGDVMRYQGDDLPAPGCAGRTAVLEALGIPQPPLFGEQVKRMRERFVALPERRVNLGWVARGCMQMWRAGRQNAEPLQASAWREGYKHVHGMLTADVHECIRGLPEYDPATLKC